MIKKLFSLFVILNLLACSSSKPTVDIPQKRKVSSIQTTKKPTLNADVKSIKQTDNGNKEVII